MKEVSLGWKDSYAGENIDIMRTTYDLVIWSMHFQQYMKNTIYKLKKLAEDVGKPLQKRGKGKIIMLKYYYQDLDASNELDYLNTYQQLVGILRWACQLGWINILTFLYRHLCNPREGHLDAVFHIFNYLNVKRKIIPGKLGFYDLEQPSYIFPNKDASMEKKYWVDL